MHDGVKYKILQMNWKIKQSINVKPILMISYQKCVW